MSAPRWKEIPGYSGYEVSDRGVVRSWRRKGRGNFRRGEPLILKQSDRKGYKSVLVMRGKKSTRLQVHRAVLLAFKGPPPEGKEDVDHLDDEPSNNLPGNLEWVSKPENISRKVQRGRQAKGEKINTAKLTEAAVLDIRGRVKTLEGELCAQYGLGVGHLRKVYRGNGWKHLASHWTEEQEGTEREEVFRRLLRENLPRIVEAAWADRAASWRAVALAAGVLVPRGKGSAVANKVRDAARRKGSPYPSRQRR